MSGQQPQQPQHQPQQQQQPRPRKFKLRVGQFNVCNLVKENTKYYGNSKYSANEVKSKVQWIAGQLAKMECHLVGFEEIFHQETLLQAVSQSGCFKQGELVCFADGSRPSVALMSAFPVVEKESIHNFPAESVLHVEGCELPLKTFQRPVLRAVVHLPNEVYLTVFVLHLKSKRPVVDAEERQDQKKQAVGYASSLILRATEAAAFRCIYINEINKHPDRPVVVMGDLNDVVHSVTTEILSGTPPWKKLPRPQREEIWRTLLYSTNELQVRLSDRDVTYSHIYNGRYEVLDHIFVSNAFNKGNPYHIGYVEYLSLLNDHLIDQTTTDDNVQNRLQSDHGQIVCQIKFYPGLQNPYHRFAQEVSQRPPGSQPAPSLARAGKDNDDNGDSYDQQDQLNEQQRPRQQQTVQGHATHASPSPQGRGIRLTEQSQQQQQTITQTQDGAGVKKKKKKKKKQITSTTAQ